MEYTTSVTFDRVTFANYLKSEHINQSQLLSGYKHDTCYCMARRCSPLRRKFMKCSINSPALSLLMKHLVIGQRLKTPNFSAFHWSPHGSLVSIGQNFVTTRVVHLPKRTETSLITESDQSGPNHQLLQLCTARTRAVHSCISWFTICFNFGRSATDDSTILIYINI